MLAPPLSAAENDGVAGRRRTGVTSPTYRARQSEWRQRRTAGGKNAVMGSHLSPRPSCFCTMFIALSYPASAGFGTLGRGAFHHTCPPRYLNDDIRKRTCFLLIRNTQVGCAQKKETLSAFSPRLRPPEGGGVMAIIRSSLLISLGNALIIYLNKVKKRRRQAKANDFIYCADLPIVAETNRSQYSNEKNVT
ncbi:hypothetical protein [Sodalis sp. (in: enterobacteria)]|uniref:hypothetical protein n=1 Tax=Sodalis sp. (in: enterobacteria) TaxID=1898979 RepID=UPI003F685532